MTAAGISPDVVANMTEEELVVEAAPNSAQLLGNSADLDFDDADAGNAVAGPEAPSPPTPSPPPRVDEESIEDARSMWRFRASEGARGLVSTATAHSTQTPARNGEYSLVCRASDHKIVYVSWIFPG